MRGDITPTEPPIEGEYEVILPPPKVWSFWRDDFPALLGMALMLAVAVYLRDFVYRLFS